MSVEKRQQREPAAEFFLMQHADGSDAMLLMGRDASGGSVCVRVPYERTLYLLPSGLATTPPAEVEGVVRCERVRLERAFEQQGAAGIRDWLAVTYRSRSAHAFNSAPPYEAVAWSDAPTEAFLVARGIKCARWLTICGAQAVPRAQQRTHCHAEYVATDVVESTARAPPDIVVLRADADVVRVESIGAGGVRTVLATAAAATDVPAMVALHDPDVLHGSLEQYATPMVRFRDRASRIRRIHLETDQSVWHTLLVAIASCCPLSAAVSPTAASEFALLHTMRECSFLPVLPARRSCAKQELPGGLLLDLVPGMHRDGLVRHYDFAAQYPSVVLEYGIDVRADLHTPLLPALMQRLVDARANAPTPAHAAAFKQCANKLFGCTGTYGARMYSPATNARIVEHGRQALQNAARIVASERLGRVIAGFTDSLLVLEGDGATAGEERLTALVNQSYRHMRLVLKDEWVSVYMSTKQNYYAALDRKSLLTIKGMLAVTQSAGVQAAIRSVCRHFLVGVADPLSFDDATLQLPANERNQVCSAITELCAMAAAMDESDVKSKLQLHERAMQRTKSLKVAARATVPDHAMRPGVAASDEAPPPAAPIEDLFKHVPLCMAADAAVVADARADDEAPDAYPHLQTLYLGVRSLGVSHEGARDAIVGISPPWKASKRSEKLDGMQAFASKALAADVQARGGDERAASCLWSCAKLRCPYWPDSEKMVMRRTLLAQRGVDAAAIEQLVSRCNSEAACASEFAARHSGRSLVLDGKEFHPAHYVQQSAQQQ
jgi:hypothetical protein